MNSKEVVRTNMEIMTNKNTSKKKKMWSAGQAPTATGVQAIERISILSQDGIDRTGGGAGSPHCSVPPLIPEQAAMLDINKGRTKIRKEPHQITKQLHQQHQ